MNEFIEELARSWKRLLFLGELVDLNEEDKQLLLKRFRHMVYGSMAVGCSCVIAGMFLRQKGFFKIKYSPELNEVKTVMTILFSSVLAGSGSLMYFMNRLHMDSNRIYSEYLKSGIITQEQVNDFNLEIEKMKNTE